MNRINIICLGVKDMRRSLHFYRDLLGFKTDVTDDNPDVVFFNTPGTKFELYPLELLAQDISNDMPPKIANGFAGITLAYNVTEKQEVDMIIERARKAGAKIIKEPQPVFWGGYHAYFMDLDGYYWEVAYGPNFRYDQDGHLLL
ncbi:MAG: VOC family protein [Erysipelotrichaceae bacterium]|nr:VOC family protein [Erysipelotrichaceae bacterium]MDD3924914.1 VOC family protein [Erysipelotrichaceae bacterium]MDD4642276.1 VOC family protein [Erysipelotrichaceae bacterium]